MTRDTSNQRVTTMESPPAGKATHIDQQMDTNDDDSFHIFVGDLAPEIEQDILLAAFKLFGNVTECKIIKDMHTQKPKGYGFVAFKHKEEAERAIQMMNGQLLGSRAIRTNWAVRRDPEDQAKDHRPLNYIEVFNASSPTNTTIYVGGLTNELSESVLRSAFKDFGDIKEIRAFKEKGFSFIRFDSHVTATQAIVTMHGRMVGDQACKCSWGKEPTYAARNKSSSSTGPIPGTLDLQATNQFTSLPGSHYPLLSYLPTTCTRDVIAPTQLSSYLLHDALQSQLANYHQHHPAVGNIHTAADASNPTSSSTKSPIDFLRPQQLTSTNLMQSSTNFNHRYWTNPDFYLDRMVDRCCLSIPLLPDATNTRGLHNMKTNIEGETSSLFSAPLISPLTMAADSTKMVNKLPNTKTRFIPDVHSKCGTQNHSVQLLTPEPSPSLQIASTLLSDPYQLMNNQTNYSFATQVPLALTTPTILEHNASFLSHQLANNYIPFNVQLRDPNLVQLPFSIPTSTVGNTFGGCGYLQPDTLTHAIPLCNMNGVSLLC